ncbi:MAG: ATP-binding protein [Myxococcales bacterium]|nr:MAG: ATP-binding protein [Myxococcales bacterium]
MLRLPLATVDRGALEDLVSNQTPESRGIEYKRDLKLDTDGEKREFAKDVSSFANAAGGFLIFGAVEKKDETGNLGYPEKMVGVSFPNWDALTQRIESIVRDRIAPRVQGLGIHKVDGFELGPVVILHIPKSWTGPHMIWFNQTHFYSRNSNGAQPLDVREIGHAFRAGAERAESIRRFRDGRLGSIIAGEGAVPLWGNQSKVVVHVCPLDTYEASRVHGFGDPARMPPFANSSGWNHRFNLDGFVTYSGSSEPGPKRSYSLAFRDGAFEGAAVFDRQPEKGYFYGRSIEETILKGAGLYAKLTQERGYSGALSVMIALTDAYNARIVWDPQNERPWSENDRIDRATLILPDVLLDSPEADVAAELKPAFDALWQSSGWEASPCYDAGTGKRRVDPGRY